MSRMYHPMQNFTTEEEFASYPYPEFDPSQAEECRREVEALHARGIAAMVPLNCTIWETAWYMRSMEEMMVGMMTDDPLTERHFERITVLAEQRPPPLRPAAPTCCISATISACSRRS